MAPKGKTPRKKSSLPNPVPADLSGPTRGKRPSISLCMIVKNEESRLATALGSAAPWVDEMIVVDTGSTDGTVALAESFGAKIYHHQWEHDFSKARNQSISYATGDWILIMDADEELDQETAPLMHKAVYSPDVNCFMFKLVNYLEHGGTSFLAHARLFRNNIGFHYEGAVHNRPIGEGKMASVPVLLYHYGYALDKESMAAKQQRRVDMISHWVESEPDNPFARSYLATTLVVDPARRVDALDQALTALRLMREQNLEKEQFPRAYWPLITGLNTMGRYEEALEHAFKCLELVPHYPDPLFQIAVAYYKMGRWEDVVTHTRRFLDLQKEAKENPARFVLFENMTVGQIKFAVMRLCLALLQLGRPEEAREAFAVLMEQDEPEQAGLITLQEGLHLNAEAARDMAQMAVDAGMGWDKLDKILEAAGEKSRQAQTAGLRDQGLEAIERGDFARAAELLGQGADLNPSDAPTLMGLAKALLKKGDREAAVPWLVKGLSMHPGHMWGYKALAEAELARGNHQGAAALLERYLTLISQDQEAAKRLEVCRRRVAEQGGPPSVAQSPPRLLILLVGGIAPDMVKAAAPHFLMGRAWGELMADANPQAADFPAWATIYTGRPPAEHGVEQEGVGRRAATLADLKLTSLWDLVARRYRLGLLSVPLACPPPDFATWALAGYPGGLLEPDLVHPPELTPLALTHGYRTDYLLSNYDEQTCCARLERDFREEAQLYQVERNRLGTAMALPAVDVLAVGINLLERMQNCFGLEPSMYRTGAYQQVYAMIDTLLAALAPQNFAIIGQRSYGNEAAERRPEGFYCLSWLKGEGGKARAQDLAPEILKLLDLDPAELGRPR